MVCPSVFRNEANFLNFLLQGGDLSAHAARERKEAQLRNNASRPLYSSTAKEEKQAALPNVYTSSSYVQNNVLSHLGSKYLLPLGTERIMKEVCCNPTTHDDRHVPVGLRRSHCTASFHRAESVAREVYQRPESRSNSQRMFSCRWCSFTSILFFLSIDSSLV